MRRKSIGKASNFKLQATRIKYQHFLENIESCTVANKFPALLDTIKSSSENLYDICYNFKEDSPCTRGLNYDNRYLGFNSNGNQMVYNQYLGDVQDAYLMGQFNEFNPTLHQLQPNKDLGPGWYKLEWDLSQYRLDENSYLQLRLLYKQGHQWQGPPPSCKVIKNISGIYRKNNVRYMPGSNHKISHLLAYTIDLCTLPLKQCSTFIEEQKDLLECYNAIILKNLFQEKESLIHKFSLSPENANLLEDVVQRLARLGLKVILEWNFNPAEMVEPAGTELIYSRQCGACQWQFDFTKDEAIIYYLSTIAHYFKQFGIRGLHLTKVHNLCKAKNGILMAKIINVMCERLSEDAITLASSKQFIPGLTEPIQEGGLGFSFTHNYHESLSLDQQHEGIYEVVKQIQASSNCLSITFAPTQKEDYIYLLFSFIIAKKGVFTRGPIDSIKSELIKVLKLRKQQQLFNQQAQMMKINEQCVIVSRGDTMILFNFSKESLSVEGDFQNKKVIFNDIEEDIKIGKGYILISGLNCIVLENSETPAKV